MISAKEAREISKKNKKILKEYSKYVYAIKDTLREYGYTVTAKYNQTNGHYLSIYW